LDEENKPIHPPVQDQAESLRSEIEEFVRRAQGKPAQQKPTQQKPAPQKPAARKSQRPRQPVAKRVPREPRPAPAGNLRREGVGEHVSKHISSADISQHAEQLGKELEQTDERMESRLHAKFDHQLGSLQHRETTAEEKTPQHDAAAEIAALLSRPEGMRQLILANEILRRPEW
ncbi:MAG: hypothetical protein MI725_11620, partial [Pirellulales bacterium]|nr:hypothetical protein [Pirellulales bacterium]